MNDTPIQFTKGTLALLVTLLEQPGWTRTIPDIIAGGRLLERLPSLADGAPALTAPRHVRNAWGLEAWPAEPFTVSDLEVKLCQQAIRHFVSNGQIGSGPVVSALLAAFKIES